LRYRGLARGFACEDKVRVRYGAFGVFGTIFRELGWETPILSWRAVPKTQNASYQVLAAGHYVQHVTIVLRRGKYL
jgi:hypothetical protein